MQFPKQKLKERSYSNDLPYTLGGLDRLWNRNAMGFPGAQRWRIRLSVHEADPGRPHMLKGGEARASGLLSLRSRARGPRLRKPERSAPARPRSARSRRAEKRMRPSWTAAPAGWDPAGPKTSTCNLKGDDTNSLVFRNLRTWAVEGSRMLFPSPKYS